MKWLKEKLQSKKEGSTLVSVIIGLTFLVALGLIVILGSSQYLTAVFVDNYAKDSFYDSETILEEVRSGLVKKASTASEEAYKEVMENYLEYKGSVKNTFAKAYITKVISKVRGISYTDYKDSAWDDLVDVEQIDGSDMVERLKKYTKKPDAVKAKDNVGNIGNKLVFVVHKTTDNLYTLTLKNIVIDYTDEADYHSTIVTDIRLNVPDLNFEGDSKLDVVKDFIVISDDSLNVPMWAQNCGFTGNIYTGNKDQGIVMNNGSQAFFNSNTIISRGSFQSLSCSDVSIKGLDGSSADVWVRNITLDKFGSGGAPDGVNGTKFDMNANAYVAGDFEINDADTTVKLAGKYYGYSYNETNDGTDPGDSEYSSAILINGYNTTFNASNLDLLELAGRTFVEKQGTDKKKSDIMMGESLAVKSDQIAYLVPDKYIKTNETTFGTNPMIWEPGKTTKEAIESCVVIKDSDEISKYLAPEKFIANYTQGGLGGTTDYVYFYLKFKNANAANQYFKDLYSGSLNVLDDEDGTIKSQLNERAETYIAATDGGMLLSGNLYAVAGNIIRYYYESSELKSTRQGSSYYNGSGTPKSELLEDGKKMGKEYVNKQLTLTSNGPAAEGQMHMTDADYDTKVVADELIDFSKLASEIKLEDAIGMVYAYPGTDLAIDGTNVKDGVVIAKGNVEVKSDFKGLIIAGGKVTVQAGKKLVNDMVMVGELFKMIEASETGDGTPAGALHEIFRKLDSTKDMPEVAPEKCVVFRNWTRE